MAPTESVSNSIAPEPVAPAPALALTAAPAAASVAAVTHALSARDAVPRVPFGTDPIPDPDATVARAFGVAGYPTLVAIDRRGNVRGRWIGFDPAIERAMTAAAAMPR